MWVPNPPLTIPSVSTTSYYSCPSSFDTNLNFFLVTWGDATTHYPFYAKYDPTLKTWSTPAPIFESPINNNGGVSGVYSAFDVNSGIFLVTWPDRTNGYPFYTIYDPTNSSWSPPLSIPNSLSVEFAVYPSFDPISGLFLVTWVDASTRMPFYATFNVAHGWSPPTPFLSRIALLLQFMEMSILHMIQIHLSF